MPLQPAKLLRIYLAESSRAGNVPLYEAIVEKCREQQISGATVMRGTEGFGCGPEIHRAHRLSHDAPVEITIVDEPEKIDLLMSALESLLQSGAIVVSNVQMIRCRETAGA